MPNGGLQARDPRAAENLFASWIAAEDHFGLPSSREAASTPRALPQPSRPPVVRRNLLTPASNPVTPRVFSDASTQTAEQDATPAVPSQHRRQASLSEVAGSSQGPQSPLQAQAAPELPPAAPSHPVRRTRSQVGRDSLNLLWREYLALTAAEVSQQQPTSSSTGRLRSSGSSSSNSPGRGAASQLRHSNNSRSGTTSRRTSGLRMSSSAVAATTTITQGPLAYDKPKGLTSLLVPLLCPPTDAIDMQALVKLLARVVLALASLLVRLSFLLVPAWLWLARHELMQGHTHDAALVALAGLIIFLVADVISTAAARADADSRRGIFCARDKADFQFAPGHYGPYGPVPSVTGANGTAALGADARSTSGRLGGGSGTAGLRSPVGARGGGAAAAAPSSTDPVVRQVKQRIIKLEYVLFGNELTEADVSPDALHNRVQLLCGQVGVPFGGPGGSSARPNVAELNQLLLAVERALGV